MSVRNRLEEIASLAFFLGSNDSGFVNGGLAQIETLSSPLTPPKREIPNNHASFSAKDNCTSAISNSL